MKGAVYYGPRDIRLEDLPTPEAGPGELLIEVARNGLCGSDLHTYLGASKGGASMHVPGVVLGHEFSGIVREVGTGVTDIAVGAAVAIAPIEWCGSCYACSHSWPQMCRKLGLYGGYRLPLHGGLAEYAVVSRRSAFTVPVGLGVVEAALAEPMAVAVHAVRRAPTTLGTTVLVLGAGPIGLGVLQAVRAAGATTIIVSEPSLARRDAARRLGASVVIDPTIENLRHVVRDLVRDGVDLVFETTAKDSALSQGLQALRPRGTLVSVAGWGDLARVDMGLAMAKELDIRYSMTYEPAVDFPATLAMLATGAFDANVLISDHIPLDSLIADGLEELLNNADQHVKILVDPSPTASNPTAPSDRSTRGTR
jgi:(R,R)-butanediol dehydrogenase / meso-butanediol dehydrogenase / diacetyl reductase